MAVRAGQAFIAVSPSFRGFKTKTETWVKSNMRAIDIQVNPVLSKKPIVMRPQKPVTVPVDVDRSRFDRSLSAIESRLDRLTRGRFLINVGIALSPIAAPALAAAVAGAAAGGGLVGAGLAGIVGMASVGAASLGRISDAQETVTKTTAASTAATQALQSARQSLASAERSAANTRINAERSIANARTAAARQVAAAENGLVDAQKKLADSQSKVRQGLADIHDARQQAIRDLQELRGRSADDALTTEGAEIGLIDAQTELSRVQNDVTSTALDLRKAKLGVAEAEDRLADARKQSADNAKELADAEKGGTEANPGVVEARKAYEDAKKERDEAKQGVRDARRELSETRASTSRDVADARADAARSIADSSAAVSAAAADLAVAQSAASAAQVDQANALAAMSPSQRAAAAGIDRLKTAWTGFQDKTDPFVLPALVKGMDALRVGMGPLAAFMAPVAVAAGQMFDAFGKALGSNGFMAWSRSFGDFAALVAGDATTGIINLARGFGSLFTAFMPLSTDMSSGLVVLTDRFATWAAGLEGSSGFNSFIDYVRENGPLLLSTLGAVGLAIIEIGKAAAPLGHQLLIIIGRVAEFTAGFAAAHPQVAAGIVAVIALSSGVAALAVPVARVVSLFRILTSPISLVVKGWAAHTAAVNAGTASTFRYRLSLIGLRIQLMALRVQQVASTLATKASTAATRAYVFIQSRLSLAYLRTLAASALITTGIIAQRVATLAVSAATRIWAAGQWLLNAAMTANPIGLVVVALVAFGATVVTMYEKVGWFRTGVDALWSGIKTGFDWLQNNWQTIATILGGPLVIMYEKVGWFRDGVNALWTGIQTGYGWVRDNWGTLATIVTAPVGLITTAFDGLKTGVGKVAEAFTTAKTGIVGVWEDIASAVTNPLDTIKKALNVFFKGIDKIASFFGLNFNFRFDVDSKPKATPGKGPAPTPHGPTKAATGGVLPGWSPGRDIHTFTSPTGGRLHLSGGEAVMRPEWTAAVGGKGAVDAMNKAAIRGGRGYANGVQAFAGGGVVWPTKSKHWTTYPGHDGIDLNGDGNGMGDPYFAAKSGRVAYTGWNRGYGNAVFLKTTGGPTLTYGHSSKVNVRAGQQVVAGQTMGLIGSTGNSTGPHLHFGLVGEGPDEGAAAVAFLGGAKMPSGKGGGGSSFNPVKEIKSVVLATKKISDSIAAGPFGGMLRKAPGKVGGMAVDWAKKKLNPIDDIADGLDRINPFDTGGIAATRGLLVKNTMRPERVLSPAQTAAFEQAMSSGFGDGGEFTLRGALELVDGDAYIEGIATKVVDKRDTVTTLGLRNG